VVLNEVARVYASALVEIGKDKNNLSQLEEELDFVQRILSEDKELLNYFKAPRISKEDKKKLIDKVFSGKLSDEMKNFIKVLIDKDRQLIITDINEYFINLIDNMKNRLRVKLITSIKLEDSFIEKIKTALKEKFKKEIILDTIINSSILGGIIIKVGDSVIDGSLSKDIRNIRGKLKNSKIRSEVAYED
jgi:F-type H+-transporting ATPase subunit delta